MPPAPPLGIAPTAVPEGFPGRVTFIKSATELSQAPHTTLPEICFCGRSNVGKSTLINTLCNRRQLARVSQTPGRTRLINFFNIQDRLTFVDLPGYGFANVPKAMQAAWGPTIQGYLAQRPQLSLALLLVDVRREPRAEERSLHAWFVASERPCLIVATKADKVSRNQLGQRLKAIAAGLEVPTRDVVAFSSLSKLGRDRLWATMLAVAAEQEAP